MKVWVGAVIQAFSSVRVRLHKTTRPRWRTLTIESSADGVPVTRVYCVNLLYRPSGAIVFYKNLPSSLVLCSAQSDVPAVKAKPYLNC